MPAIAPSRRQTLLIILAFAAIYIIWGTTYLFIRIAVETIPAFLMAGTRFVIAGTLTMAVLRWRGVPWPKRIEWRSGIIVGAFLLFGGSGFLTWSEQEVPSGIAALVVATMPLWMALFDWLFFARTAPRARTGTGLVLGFVGLALLLAPRLAADTDNISPLSWTVVFLSPVLWSIGSLYSRQAKLPENPFMATAMESLAGGALLLVAGLATGEGARLDLAEVSTGSLLSMVYLVLFGSIVGFTAYVWLLKQVEAARVATYTYVNPVIAVFLGWLVFAEPVTWQMLAAAGIILVGVALITTTKRRGGSEEVSQRSAEVAQRSAETL